MRILRSLRRALPVAAAIALAACGGGGSENAASSSSSSSSSSGSSSSSSSSSSSGSSSPVYSTSSANVVAVAVGPGPTQSSSFFNIPTTTVKVCLPNSTTSCQTISNVLVDTGSYGLRLLASALNGLVTSANYQPDPATAGNFIAECLPFADGYTWGPVTTVDVYIGGEKGSGVPINIIDDSSSGATLEPAAPSTCMSSGNNSNIGSADNLGANGVLGVGLFSYDCGTYCALPVASQNSSTPSPYYTCSPSACTTTTEPLASQVINPVALFTTDNNGVILQLTAVGTTGATTASGFLVFGIGTETNNGLGKATVLTTNDEGFISTTFNGQALNSSFLDSGSNGLYFPDSSLPNCGSTTVLMEFYCPTSTQTFTATNQGQNGSTTDVTFYIGDLNTISDTDFAISDVGGPSTSISGIGTAYFDFGLPFFFGRTIFTGMQTSVTAPPYFAY